MIFDEYILGLPVGGNVLKCLKSKLKSKKIFNWHAQCFLIYSSTDKLCVGIEKFWTFEKLKY